MPEDKQWQTFNTGIVGISILELAATARFWKVDHKNAYGMTHKLSKGRGWWNGIMGIEHYYMLYEIISVNNDLLVK